MNPILKNILAILIGYIGGSIVNMAFVFLGMAVAPPPGISGMPTTEQLAAAMPNFTTINFVFPFLAHAIGTLAGAFIAAKVAATRKMTFAMVIGVLFFLGGIGAATMLPSPVWFTVLDLALAYFPMAYIGGKLGMRSNPVS